MRDLAKKIIYIFRWFFCALFILPLLLLGLNYVSGAAMAVAVLALPIRPIEWLWGRLPLSEHRWVRPLVAVVALVVIALMSAYDITYIELDEIPAFDEDPFVVLYHNTPNFSTEEIKADSFERYSDLDELGRCGVAVACIGPDIMPTEERESLSSVTPSGWHSVEYEVVQGGYLYNRSHLIGFQLTGENANEENLITGTRFMNVEGMLPFENMVADYVDETGNHVMYRVTPVFFDDNLVACGVLLEAYSVEDDGKEIRFNVFVYNAQPGVTIDYSSGESFEKRE